MGLLDMASKDMDEILDITTQLKGCMFVYEGLVGQLTHRLEIEVGLRRKEELENLKLSTKVSFLETRSERKLRLQK